MAMAMAMVEVGGMGVFVHQGGMAMGVAVRLPERVIHAMAVAMVLVMNVTVRVAQRLMDVAVNMAFGEMQP